MPMKTMRNLVTKGELTNRKPPRDREQALTELARLEGEKTRHAHALEVWLAHQQTTERKLEQINARIALVQQSLGMQPPAEPTPAPQPPSNDGDWEPFVLQY